MDVLRRARPWVRGYSRAQVDAYRERAVAALTLSESEPLRADQAGGPAVPPGFSAAEIRRVGFSFQWGGWDCASVDRMLDALEQRAVELTLQRREPAEVLHALDRESSQLRARFDGRADGERFPRTEGGAKGYEPADVDALVRRLLGGWGDGIDSDDIRFAVFASRSGGYDEEVVDEALDDVVDLALRRGAAAQLVMAHQGGQHDEATALRGPSVDTVGSVGSVGSVGAES